MSEKPHDVYGRYSDENLYKDLPWCSAAIVISGAHYPCDLVPPHDGFAHANREVEALWACSLVN